MFHHVNFVAVAVAALLTFLVGGPWYSKGVFGSRWNRESGRDTMKKGAHPAVAFGLAYVAAFAAGSVLAAVIGDAPPSIAVHIGLAVGLGIAGGSFGINYAFGGRSLVMWLIDAGYNTLLFVLMAAVISYWR
jgi:hypothetical protein